MALKLFCLILDFDFDRFLSFEGPCSIRRLDYKVDVAKELMESRDLCFYFNSSLDLRAGFFFSGLLEGVIYIKLFYCSRESKRLINPFACIIVDMIVAVFVCCWYC